MILLLLIFLFIIFFTQDLALCQELLTIEEKILLFQDSLTLKDKEFYIWLVQEFSVIDINLEFLESKEEIRLYAKEVVDKYLNR